jgi:spore coat protein U-like protein
VVLRVRLVRSELAGTRGLVALKDATEMITGNDVRKYFVFIATFVLGASSSEAATSVGNFTTHVKLNATCKVSATNLDFGTLPGLILGTETTTSNVSVTCTKNTTYSLALSAGTVMIGVTTPADRVRYTAAFTTATTGTGNGVAQSYTISGALRVQATPSAQDYTATRRVTVTY